MTLTDAGKALNAFVEAVGEALQAGDGVQLPGFGSLKVKERAAREGINPATKEKIWIEAKKTIKFKAGKGLEESIQ
jgi:DNA-binding protein HU-beta